MTFNEFYDAHCYFVVPFCFDRLPADQVEATSTKIIRQAYKWVCDGKPADYSIRWALSMMLPSSAA